MDINDRRLKQLSNTFHLLSVRNLLLTNEVLGLRKALKNEKKKRKRGKPLLLEQPADYHGGAIFYSPSKVKQARDNQARKEAEAEAVRY